MKNEHHEDKGIEDIINVIQRIASGDFFTRVPITEKGDSLDAIATGINMLAEEIEAYTKEKDDQSEVLLNMLEDVNEAKEEAENAQEALRESEEKLRSILESSPDSISVTDLDGKLIECNQATLDLYGFSSKDEVIGKVAFEFIAKQDQGRAMMNMEKTLELGLQKNIEYTLLTKHGKEFLGELSAAVIRDAKGNPISFVAITKDITDRVRAEEKLKQTMKELERSNTELQQFAYVASHDLQEPLRMISSYMQLLSERYKGKLDEDAREFIRYATDGAHRMWQLINDLLTLSRLDTTGKPFEPIDSKEIFKQVVENLSVAIDESKTVISYDFLPTVTADASQMIQLLQNLIANSIKFRGNKPPKINISAEKKEDEWLFSIRDNGIGIDPKYQKRIFQIFHRLHSRDDYPGTGIGLAVCKKIVERHGGRIWVESEPQKGSTFYFTIHTRGGDKHEY